MNFDAYRLICVRKALTSNGSELLIAFKIDRKRNKSMKNLVMLTIYLFSHSVFADSKGELDISVSGGANLHSGRSV